MQINTMAIAVVLGFFLFFSSMLNASEVALWGNYQKAPKIYLDTNKQAKGILIDVAKLLSEKTGIKFTYELAPWARAYYQAQRSKHANTGIIGIKKNPERLKLFDFSKPVYSDKNYLVVLKKRGFKIKAIEDLKGLKVSYNRKGYFGPKFEEAKQYFIDAADTNNNLRLKKLLLGRIDAALIGGPGRLGLKMAISKDASLRQHADKFELLPIEFENPDHIAFSKNRQLGDILEKINTAIDELNAHGEIQKIIERYQEKG